MSPGNQDFLSMTTRTRGVQQVDNNISATEAEAAKQRRKWAWSSQEPRGLEDTQGQDAAQQQSLYNLCKIRTS